MNTIRPAVFLDRDGVINRDTGLCASFEELEIYSYVPESIKRLNDAGFTVVVVSNQAIIARGMADEALLVKIHDQLISFVKEKSGGVIERVYYCPHHPDADVEEYRVNCDCRKPKPGMLRTAAEEFCLNLKASYMVGDRSTDIAAGSRAGCTTILVNTGKHTEASIQTVETGWQVEPDYTCLDLREAVSVILTDRES